MQPSLAKIDPPPSPAERQLQSLLDLTANPLLSQDGLTAMLQLITETAANTLEVERVSIWHEDTTRGALCCLDLFERSVGRHSAGIELNAAEFPGYFASLHQCDVIAAPRASEDPRTREFHTNFLEPFCVSSMLDATIHIAGGIYGVLRHEQVGPPRTWTHGETSFAVAVANLVARAIAEQERRQAAVALRSSEHRYRSFFEGSPLPAYVFDPVTLRFIDVSDSMVAHYGYSRQEFLRMTTLDMRPASDEPRLRASIAELTHNRAVMGIWQHYKKDGTRMEVEISAQLIDFAGQRAALVVTVDMTHRIQMERALRESDERFRQMADNIGEMFWMKDPSTHVMLYVSRAFTGIWGRSVAEIYSGPDAFLNTIYPPDKELVASRITEPMAAEVCTKYRIQRPDGTIRWIRDRAFPVRDAAGKLFRVVGVAEDVTEHEQLEQSFLRAQRMESLGQLAGGIAHDLNNILAPVLMAAPLLREPLDPALHTRILDTVETSARRGAELVKQLLLFGRGSNGERTVLRLKDAVREVQGILRETLPKNCKLSVELPDDLWLVRADATQMHQVLLNLCVNARDAMPEGGTLVIAAENRTLAEWEARPIPGAQPGPHVLLRVTDSGTGIPPTLLEKIFDPFFTSKANGKGTGLGLATVASIAKSHSGFITVQSELGHGSTFCFGLPAELAATTLASTRPTGVVASPPLGHGENILVVDDEESNRTLLQEILTHHGYVVHTASGGVDGAALFVALSTNLRVVIADLNMPQMDGLTMLQLIRKVDPTMPAIVLSGSIGGEKWATTATELDRLGVTAVLSKPFSARSILDTLHDALTPRRT